MLLHMINIAVYISICKKILPRLHNYLSMQTIVKTNIQTESIIAFTGTISYYVFIIKSCYIVSYKYWAPYIYYKILTAQMHFK